MALNLIPPYNSQLEADPRQTGFQAFVAIELVCQQVTDVESLNSYVTRRCIRVQSAADAHIKDCPCTLPADLPILLSTLKQKNSLLGFDFLRPVQI